MHSHVLRVLLSLLCVTALCLCAGCGASRTAEDDTSETVSTEPTEPTEPTELPVDEEDEFRASAEALFKDLRRAASAGDYDAFSSLFHDTDDAFIQADFEGCSTLADCNQFFAIPITSVSKDCRVVAFQYAKSNGSDRKPTVGGGLYTLVKVDGAWKIRYDEQFLIDHPQIEQTLYPAGLRDALENDRVAQAFNNHLWFHFDETQAVQGCLYTDVRYAWQEKNGDLTIEFFASNGLVQDKVLLLSSLLIEDEKLGTIYKGSPQNRCTVRSDRNCLFTVTIPSSELDVDGEPLSNLYITYHTSTGTTR